MAFLGVDSWRWQYFENQPVPEGVSIPIDDASAWELYPDHRWIYNKLLVCESQGLPHGPHGVMPKQYPVFSKPIYNLRGMGTGSSVFHSEEEYLAGIKPGYFWMPNFTGPHVSTDAALEAGEPRWWRHTTGKPGRGGTFDYWTIHAAPDPALERYLGEWVKRHLAGFSGVVNFETIGGRIIETHLRMAEQWLDLNGTGWLPAVVELYSKGRWNFEDRRRDGHSVVLFGDHVEHQKIDRQAVRRYLARPEISSIQITFDEDVPLAHHAQPPGGFRLAIVNCWDLEAGRAVRRELRQLFGVRNDEGAAQ